MQKNMRNNEQAVSPVIGVILMVVITVIIAAIIAVFAFGMGAPAKAPQTSIKATSADITVNTVTLEHQGGDQLRLSDVKLVIEQTDAAGVITRASYDTAGAATNKFQAGDKLVVQTNPPAVGGITLNGVATVATVPGAPGTVDIGAGATVTITVVDIPTDQLVTKTTIRT